MGKSLWTHALLDPEVRARVSNIYSQPLLAKSEVVIGFNGSDKASSVAPTRDAISRALKASYTADDVWRAVIFRAMRLVLDQPQDMHLEASLAELRSDPVLFEDALTKADDALVAQGKIVLILFDALDRLADDWKTIRLLTSGLLKRALGLRSFRSFRTKIFIRPDQYADSSIFQFPDGSKLKNDHVNLSWEPYELFGLLLFEVSRNPTAKDALEAIADELRARSALLFSQRHNHPAIDEQIKIVNALAGQYMGSDARRGRVYTWVPLHLSDAKNTCSPRTFLTAWQRAAVHEPVPSHRVVDHLGLLEGVRRASSTRLEELREDYRWIDGALGALRGEFVPIERRDLMRIWERSQVVQKILADSHSEHWLAPVELELGEGASTLLEATISIAVMEERANGKINVPDIFRVEAGIKRKGGVAVPRRG
ncbi:MAG TPA: hypothetical protein VFE22_11870 [Edaphobacter sp.]|nr:hypothetical protein [Edaphobacter sp.]